MSMPEHDDSATAETVEREFDLSPSPRILPMLGEISLEEWQCIGELVDNSIDGFLFAAREGRAIERPEVHVHLPTRRDGSPRISVRDNGPGMTPDTLESAVKAGWTRNDPVASLGMFGMGFNIATARLGTVTRVWSTREGDGLWHGVEIDFQRLMEQRHFRTPMLHRHKTDPITHGTEVSIERLKPDQADWFARSGNHSKLRRELGRVYSSMLRPDGAPLSIQMLVNGTLVAGRRHCVWGGLESPERKVPHNRFGEVNAFQRIDRALPSRPYCMGCWYWLPAGDTVCPSCETNRDVVERERRIRGWIGIQRYLEASEFGIDFFRNGRKIERASQDLFHWRDENGLEREYPIDDPRHRGRIVGEIHLDHARVYYTKDRFDRNDPAWEDMVRLVRGEGPLRPDKARTLGFGPNDSPLHQLFQAFRRSSPKPKVAGAYAKHLIVPDNDRAREMADRFHAGETDYQSDEKWYELVVEADVELLTQDAPHTAPNDDEFWDNDPPRSSGDGGQPVTGPATVPEEEREPERPEPPRRDPIAGLSRQYRDDLTNMQWDVRSFAARADDPELVDPERPWSLRRSTAGHHEFVVNANHPVFRSATMTPVDALLAELAWAAMDFHRGRDTGTTFGAVLSSLRSRYATRSELDPVTLNSEASSTLRSIARSLSRNVDASDARALFEDLAVGDKRFVLTRLASTAGAEATKLIEEGRFLEYAPKSTLLRFFETHPDLFFDGRYWDVPYGELDFVDAQVTDEARAEVVRRYGCLLSDAVWLAEHDPTDLDAAGRARLLRGMLALDLLSADVVGDV
jgi:Histidine kinase-, DNA gyrase B-, and HSP90-like ATPase